MSIAQVSELLDQLALRHSASIRTPYSYMHALELHKFHSHLFHKFQSQRKAKTLATPSGYCPQQIGSGRKRSMTESDITFSKSRRDSTRDQVGVRSIILGALDLTSELSGIVRRKPAFKQEKIIIDARMVAFSGDEVAGTIYICFKF